ncbi:MAG: YceI family protein, partial [Halobacteriales archaeon]|nr:YceI family protein [Halobacteriales archaeon]
MDSPRAVGVTTGKEPHMSTTLTLPQTGTWAIDTAHTMIGFSVKHLMTSRVRGGFDRFDGTIRMADTPEQSSVEVTIDAASITTGAEDRDAHLRSPDFLDADSFPTIHFASTDVRAIGGGRYEVDGDLTIKDETQPVTLDLVYAGLVTDPWGNDKAIFSASATVDRERWGLTWNQALEAGGWLVGKTVDI